MDAVDHKDPPDDPLSFFAMQRRLIVKRHCLCCFGCTRIYNDEDTNSELPSVKQMIQAACKMCYTVHVNSWACGCPLLPRHEIPSYIRKRCERQSETDRYRVCSMGMSAGFRQLIIPAQCPECHTTIMQNQFRSLFALTGHSVQNILSYLDSTSAARDCLNGADLPVTNGLENDLKGLQYNIARCLDLFCRARNVAMEAFLGPLESEVYENHTKIIKDMCHWSNTWATESILRGRVPPYSGPAEDETRASAHNESANSLLDRTASGTQPPPYDYNSTETLEITDIPENLVAMDDIDHGSTTSASDGSTFHHIAILERSVRRLTDELFQLTSGPNPSENPIFTFTAAQSAAFRPNLTATSAQQRTHREKQVHAHLKILYDLIREEHLIMWLDLIARRAMRDFSTGAIGSELMLDTFRVYTLTIDTFYRNRAGAGLSALLLPLNGTDPSKAHVIPLLPREDDIFPAGVVGFPGWVDGQLNEFDSGRALRAIVHLFEYDEPNSEGAMLVACLKKDCSEAIEKGLRDQEEQAGLRDGEAAGSSRQLTETALREHDGLQVAPEAKPAVEDYEIKYRTRARDIAVHMKKYEASLSGGYPVIDRAPAKLMGYLEYRPKLKVAHEKVREALGDVVSFQEEEEEV
jgi:hypothetical protein